MNLYQEVALSFKKVGDPCSRLFNLFPLNVRKRSTWEGDSTFHAHLWGINTNKWRNKVKWICNA